MYNVNVCDYDGLPDSEKDKWPPDSDCSFLVVEHDGKVLRVETDGGEPEDNMFFRSYSWIDTALLEAYKCGLKDAKVAGSKK